LRAERRLWGSPARLRTPPVVQEGKMVVYVSESGSDRTELIETLQAEGVAYQELEAQTARELGFSSVGMLQVRANLPEERRPGVTDERFWRLPSGRLIVTDMENNLDRIETPPPGK
jgi:hypothetical protein